VDPPAPDLANVITLGMSMDGANADMNVLNSYSRLVGRQPAVLNSFQDWQTSSFDSNRMSALTARGITPMITWEPWAAGGGSLQLDFTLRSIIRGRHDAYIHQWARSSAAWNHTYYLRFAHEMNDNSYPWAASTNTNTAARYIQAWQHVHDIFVADGATKVLWVWAPAKEYAGTTPLASVYPGSAYVDLIGLDAYNGGTALWGHSWVLAPGAGLAYLQRPDRPRPHQADLVDGNLVGRDGRRQGRLDPTGISSRYPPDIYEYQGCDLVQQQQGSRLARELICRVT